MEMAKKVGADEVIFSDTDLRERLLRANGGKPVDNVITCTGNKGAIERALMCVDRAGRVLFFAPTDPGVKVSIPFNELWREEVTLSSSYGAVEKEILDAIEILRTGRIDVNPLITHRLPIEQTGAGFKLVASAGESLKVIIKF
jgi:L-iditol 2-dehydrogenase